MKWKRRGRERTNKEKGDWFPTHTHFTLSFLKISWNDYLLNYSTKMMITSIIFPFLPSIFFITPLSSSCSKQASCLNARPFCPPSSLFDATLRNPSRRDSRPVKVCKNHELMSAHHSCSFCLSQLQFFFPLLSSSPFPRVLSSRQRFLHQKHHITFTPISSPPSRLNTCIKQRVPSVIDGIKGSFIDILALEGAEWPQNGSIEFLRCNDDDRSTCEGTE